MATPLVTHKAAGDSPGARRRLEHRAVPRPRRNARAWPAASSAEKAAACIAMAAAATRASTAKAIKPSISVNPRFIGRLPSKTGSYRSELDRSAPVPSPPGSPSLP